MSFKSTVVQPHELSMVLIIIESFGYGFSSTKEVKTTPLDSKISPKS